MKLLLSTFLFLSLAAFAQVKPSGAPITANRIIRSTGVPPAGQCALSTDVGKVYIRSNAAATNSSFYSCDNTASMTYAWELSGGSGGFVVASPTVVGNLIASTNTLGTAGGDSGVNKNSIPAGQYTLSANGIVAGDVDPGGANSAAILALLATVNTAGGGNILCDKSGTYRFDSQILMPNDGGMPAHQSNIIFTGVGGGPNWYAGTGLAQNACIFDLRYQGNLGAKIESLGRGSLGIQNIQFQDGSTAPAYSVTGGTLTNIVVTGNVAVATFASPILTGAYVGAQWAVSGSTTAALNQPSATKPTSYTVTAVGTSTITFTTTGVGNATYSNAALTLTYSAPFVHDTDTVITAKDNTFVGNSSIQNGFVLGGTSTATETGTLNAAFQGYGTSIRNNTFLAMNAGMLARTYANSIWFEGNKFISDTGTIAIYVDNGLQTCNAPQFVTGLHVNFNIVEMDTGYVYGMYLGCTNQSQFLGNDFYDQQSPAAFDYFLGSGSFNNFIVPGFTAAVTTKFFGGDATALQTTSILSGTQYNPTGASTGLTSGELYGLVVKGRYNGTKDYPGQFTVTDVFAPDDRISFGIDETAKNQRAILDSNFTMGLQTSGNPIHFYGDPTSRTGRLAYLSGTEPTCLTATDLVIDGTDNTKVTSASHLFATADVNAKLEVTAGSSWTPGTYYIKSVNFNAAILSASPGATGLTGGTWNLNRSMQVVVEGGAGVADTMRICAQAADNTVAYRAIY